MFELDIRLTEIDPPVWRRILIPGDWTLATLHSVIQRAMPRENRHLHEYFTADARYGVRDPDCDLGDGPKLQSERGRRIAQVLHEPGDSLLYVYDFGDNWQHRITLQAKLPLDPTLRLPVCTAGERACPPEDCGGEMGYADLLRAIASPRRRASRELLEWLPPGFDPERIRLEEINRRLSRLGPRPRRKTAP